MTGLRRTSRKDFPSPERRGNCDIQLNDYVHSTDLRYRLTLGGADYLAETALHCSSLIAASVLALTTTASAISPPTPWDGANPFHCTIQNAGFGPTGPKPVAHWANRIELLAMVEDTHDGTFYAPPPTGGAIRAGSGPIAIGTFNYAMSEQSVAIRQAANAAMRGIANIAGSGGSWR